jgi:hypothetical protein
MSKRVVCVSEACLGVKFLQAKLEAHRYHLVNWLQRDPDFYTVDAVSGDVAAMQEYDKLSEAVEAFKEFGTTGADSITLAAVWSAPGGLGDGVINLVVKDR